MSAVKDANGDLWFASMRSGVWLYDGKTMHHFPVEHQERAVTIFSIYKDRQNVLWLGTHERGAYRWDDEGFAPARF